jgi:hypothetical protein
LRQVQEELSWRRRTIEQSRFELVKDSPPERCRRASETSLQEYQAKLTDLRQEHSELATTFTAEHRKMKKVQARLRRSRRR